MLGGFRVDRLLLVAALAAAVQDVPTSRQVDLTLTQGTSMSAAASPDRRSIAIDLLGGIWILPFRGGEARRITPELLEARQPTWSPDGQSIAFQGYDDGTWHIYVMASAGGEAKAITAGAFDDREPAWSHDGSRIAFSSDRYGGITTVWTVNAGGGDPTRVTARDGWMPTWSPNDQEITFVSTDGAEGDDRRDASPGLWTVDGDGRERHIVTDVKAEGVPSAAAWNPAGRELAYVAAARLYAGGGVQPALDVFPFKPQWVSAREILYTASGQIWHMTLGDGAMEARIVPFSAKVSLQRSTFPIAHRALEPREPQPVTGIVNPVVSPDGRAIAFTALGDLWVLPAGESPLQITNDAAMEIDPAWSPDGGQLAFASDRAGHMDL